MQPPTLPGTAASPPRQAPRRPIKKFPFNAPSTRACWWRSPATRCPMGRQRAGSGAGPRQRRLPPAVPGAPLRLGRWPHRRPPVRPSANRSCQRHCPISRRDRVRDHPSGPQAALRPPRPRPGPSRGTPRADRCRTSRPRPDHRTGRAAGTRPRGDPERAVERIEFIPRGPRFILAGITTSDVDEHPFVRGPARPVRLVAQDGRNGVFEIDVDRGVATYPQPLPGQDDRQAGSGRRNVRVYIDRRAAVGYRRGPARRGGARPGALGRHGTRWPG